jgi:putative membrane protein insertion efficiency factor
VSKFADALGKAAAACLKLPILIYRYSFKPFVGHNCRHLPTCSEYALEAIDRNGAWRGFWLTVSRVLRCHPWGTSGFDPVPDIRAERHPFWAPWRYGRWRPAQLPSRPPEGSGVRR